MNSLEKLIRKQFPEEKILAKSVGTFNITTGINQDIPFFGDKGNSLSPVKLVETEHFYVFDKRDSHMKSFTKLCFLGIVGIIVMVLGLIFFHQGFKDGIIFSVFVALFVTVGLIAQKAAKYDEFNILKIEKIWITENNVSKNQLRIKGQLPRENNFLLLDAVTDKSKYKKRKYLKYEGAHFTIKFWKDAE